ncbi:MAG: OmpA family protein [Bacteroidales bacterium]|nr:OmpA family protein [Bacteroidales bacterium]
MKKHWLPLFSLLAMLHWCSALAQNTENLVFNGSFEEYSTCPQRIDALGIMSGVDAWWQPTKGSSDYFNACGGRECLTPRNKMGVQEPHSGVAYCGIYCSKENYREYLQTELKEPLKKGRRYRVSFWASLADKSPNAIATLGALFTVDRIADTTWNILMHNETTDLGNGQKQVVATYYTPQVAQPSRYVLIYMDQWNEISGEFIAEGGEKYLTIGNFNSFNRSGVVETRAENTVLSGAYYYIDDVSVVCLDCDAEPQPVDTVPAPAKGDIITLRNVLFNTDESVLLPQSYNDLHSLIDLLNAHPSMKIELRGHTDNQGTVERNRILSDERAKAVADYLIEHGIDRQRLRWKGFGKSMPIDTNDTPEGRHNNRRVEYRVTAE